MTRAGMASAFVLWFLLAPPNARPQQKRPPAQQPEGKHYVLPADKDTVQWGWLDPNESPSSS
jgi:hypothetical protein